MAVVSRRWLRASRGLAGIMRMLSCVLALVVLVAAKMRVM